MARHDGPGAQPSGRHLRLSGRAGAPPAHRAHPCGPGARTPRGQAPGSAPGIHVRARERRRPRGAGHVHPPGRSGVEGWRHHLARLHQVEGVRGKPLLARRVSTHVDPAGWLRPLSSARNVRFPRARPHTSHAPLTPPPRATPQPGQVAGRWGIAARPGESAPSPRRQGLSTTYPALHSIAGPRISVLRPGSTQRPRRQTGEQPGGVAKLSIIPQASIKCRLNSSYSRLTTHSYLAGRQAGPNGGQSRITVQSPSRSQCAALSTATRP